MIHYTYHGQEREGVIEMYNLTFFNERSVELSVVYEWIEGRNPYNGLEIGNVLGHYGPRYHDVLDLYETGAWHQADQRVINDDVLTWEPRQKYSWLVSISTVEHVGEPPHSWGASLHALNRIGSWGIPTLVTFPLGYNPALDEWVLAGAPGWDFTTLEKDGMQHWCEQETVRILPYGSRDPWAASLFIGTLNGNETLPD